MDVITYFSRCFYIVVFELELKGQNHQTKKNRVPSNPVSLLAGSVNVPACYYVSLTGDLDWSGEALSR